MEIKLLVGMIGSGKSTYARAQARDNSLIVCHDDLLTMIHGKYQYHSFMRKCYQTMEENLVRDAIWSRHDVVIDRTNLTHESRKRWREFALAHNVRHPTLRVDLVAVVFPIEAPEIHALRRFSSDPRGLSFKEWLEVANKHYEQAMSNPVDDDEGFARVERRGFEPPADESIYGRSPEALALSAEEIVRTVATECRRKVALAEREHERMMWNMMDARSEIAKLKASRPTTPETPKVPEGPRPQDSPTPREVPRVTARPPAPAKPPGKPKAPPKPKAPRKPKKEDSGWSFRPDPVNSFDLSVFRDK